MQRITLVLALLTQACVYNGPFALYEPKETGLFQTSTPFNPKTKIFLVAAGNDAAVYANEVVQQRRFWISQGVPESEISCYYVVPDRNHYDLNSIRFRRITDDMTKCYYASTTLLEEHLKTASAAKNDYVYLYVTGHGSYPEPKTCPALNHYYISMYSNEKTTLEKNVWEDEVCKSGRPIPLFSPAYLEQLLVVYPKSSHKYVVLQACHSGGFIYEPEKNKAPLAKLDNLEIFTAAHANRTSFGCSPGESMTIFGEEYFNVLKKLKPKSPSNIDWRRTTNEVCKQIDDRENSLRIKETSKSYPQYMTTKK